MGAERRILIPLSSRILLSMLAPRLMRFQFDMMLSAIISEAVRKFVVPMMSHNGPHNPRLNILGSLLGGHSVAHHPPYDLKDMLAKAQSALQAQGANVNGLKTGGLPPLVGTSSLPPMTPDQMNHLMHTLGQSAPNQYATQQSNEISQQVDPSSQQAGGSKVPPNQVPVQMIPVPMQMHPGAHPGKHVGAPNMFMSQPMQMQQPLQIAPVTQMVQGQSAQYGQGPSDNQQVKQGEMQGMPPLPVPPKMSHPWHPGPPSGPNHDPNSQYFQLTHLPANYSSESMEDQSRKNEEYHNVNLPVNYIDHNLVNYGNQVSQNEIQTEPNYQTADQQASDSNIKNHKLYYHNDDQTGDRANRWNSILINMDKYRTKRRHMKYSILYRIIKPFDII